MEMFTIHDIAVVIIPMVNTFLELNGAIAATLVQNVLAPFHDFNGATVLSAVGAAAILWKKKSWILSGLVHLK